MGEMKVWGVAGIGTIPVSLKAFITPISLWIFLFLFGGQI
jgi:hypothetical protein